MGWENTRKRAPPKDPAQLISDTTVHRLYHAAKALKEISVHLGLHYTTIGKVVQIEK